MSQSANLMMPYLAPGQAQKHVTVNESLRRLDAVVQLAVVSASVETQPGSPADGAVFILPPGKTGAAWGPMANHALAYHRDGAWEQISPREGWLAYVRDADSFVYFDGSTWTELATGEGGGGDYTDEMARDAIGAALVAGAGIDISIDDGADTITVSTTGGEGSPEAADVDFDPTGMTVIAATNVQGALEQLDAAIDALPGGGGDYTDEMARDAIGAALAAGAGIDISIDDGADTITISATGGAGREVLTVDRTYYVRSDGSDSNSGLSNTSAGAFASIQKALDVCARIDFGGHVVTIQLADATYTAGGVIPRMTGQGDAANLILRGNNSTPGNVIVSTTSADCFLVAAPGAMARILDMELRTTTAGNCLTADRGGLIEWGNVRFGACAGRHVRAQSGGVAEAAGNYAITGGATHHWSASGGLINVVGRTVTLTGTPAFSGQFCDSTTNATVRAFSNTYSGSATGPRHAAATGGGVQTAGAGVNNLPGNSIGSTTSPGWAA